MHGLTRGKHRYYECGRQKEIQRQVGDGLAVKKSDICEGTTVREDHVLEWLGDYLADELSLGGEVDLREMTKIAKAGKVTEAELPQAFAKLKRMFVKDTAPQSDVKRTEKRIAAIDADLTKAKRNLVLVDPKHIGEIEKAIEEYEQERLALVQQLKDQPKAGDINDALLGVLHSLILLWRRDSTSVKASMREIDAITCRTVRRGEGRATRHSLTQVRFAFVGGVTSKTNHRRLYVKQASSPLEHGTASSL